MSQLTLKLSMVLALTCALSTTQSSEAGTIVTEAETAPNMVIGGSTLRQNMKQFGTNWSKNRQLLWTPANNGDKLQLRFNVPKTGLYRVRLNVTKANDFGFVAIGMNGRRKLGYNGFSSTINRVQLDLGEMLLPAGQQWVIFISEGKAINSLGRRVGVDNIELVPVGGP